MMAHCCSLIRLFARIERDGNNHGGNVARTTSRQGHPIFLFTEPSTRSLTLKATHPIYAAEPRHAEANCPAFQGQPGLLSEGALLAASAVHHDFGGVRYRWGRPRLLLLRRLGRHV